MSQSDSQGLAPPSPQPPHHARKRVTHPGTRATGSCGFPLGQRLGVAKVYQKLKKLAPQSEETIGARELIKAAVIRGK